MPLNHSKKTEFVPSKDAGEALRHAFAPRMGKRYANGRNFDRAISAYGAFMGISHLEAYQRIRDTAVEVSDSPDCYLNLWLKPYHVLPISNLDSHLY